MFYSRGRQPPARVPIMAREVILYGTRRREYFSKTRLRTFFFFRELLILGEK